jgi:GH18 family chitinase
MASLKTALGTKIVSTAIGLDPKFIDVAQLSRSIDWIYIMAYDLE